MIIGWAAVIIGWSAVIIGWAAVIIGWADVLIGWAVRCDLREEDARLPGPNNLRLVRQGLAWSNISVYADVTPHARH